MKLRYYCKAIALLSFLLFTHYLSAQCPTAAGDATINCGSTTALTAAAAPNNGFTWSSAPCPPLSTGGTNAFPVTCDDCVTGQIPIGFTFNYFGGSYTTAVIQSNGIVGFGPFTFTGFSSFAIPAGGAPNNYIAGMFADIDIRYGGTITYQTIGVAPNRSFVVSYTNVVPYNSGSGAGTGTASFQIVLNENGSFNIIISQLSANWNASTSGALATSGCENADGTVAVPIPGRNATDWPGITPAQQDCNTFAPITCSFLRWQQGATIISTNPVHNVSPTTSTTYTAYWNCGGTTCTDDVVITLNTTLTAGGPTNNTSCVTPNGSIPFTTTGFANGTYTLNYTLNGTPTSSTITITGNTFTLPGLNTGTYSNFSITSGACSATSPASIAITSPATPTTTGTTICQGGSGTITTSSCGVPGVTTAQGAVFNSGNLAASDPTWVRPYGGTSCSVSGTTVYYDVYSFYVSTAGSYTFTGCFPTIDGYGHLYQNAFTPAAPCGTPANFVVGDDDSAPLCGADPMFTATLTPGVQYFLISTSFSSSATDSYSWTFTGPAAATISTSLGSSIEWYTAPTGGSSIANSSPFNPVGVAGSGLANTNTPGTYTYYSACSNASTCRTATTFVISAASVPPTSISGTGTICNGQSTTLSVVGGTLATGASWNWYTGSCGGTLVGTGNSITVTPTATTTYFVGASAGTACPASGCTSGTVTLPIAGTTLANNGESATCLVNQNGYIHFYHSSGRLICSINSNGQNLGNVTATAYVFGAPVNVPACSAPASYMVTALGREWLINPQFQPAAGVDVVLHFDNGEYTTLAPVANANISAWDNLTGIADLKLSKYSGPLNMDNNALNNCVSAGGSGGTTLHTQAANGNTSTMLPGFSASARFTRFNIPNFSEFWLHGMSGTSPLPVELSSFSASCLEANKADIVWKTESEVNCASYVVESSRDINTWSVVGEVVCVGNNAQGNTYHLTDNNREVGNTYYRLIQEDTDGNKTTYGPIMLTCSSDGWSITSHPNPADEMVTIMINSDKKQTECTIQLFDFTGKLIKTQVVSTSSYQTLVPLDVKELSAGAYSVRVTSDDNKIETLKVIVQH